MAELNRKAEELKRQLAKEYEDGECSTDEEPDIGSIPTPRGKAQSDRDSEFRELSLTMAQQSQSIAKLTARQSGLKELPRFSGEVEEWPIFLSQYEQSTNSGGYSSAENVSRLEKCLSGEARNAVKTLLSIPTSAELIINTLRQRYGNPRQMLQRLTAQAIAAEKPKDDNPHSIINFATLTRNITFALKNLDEGRFLFGSTILDELEKKLSPLMKMMWAEVIHAKPNYTLEDLADWLGKRAEFAIHIAPYCETSQRVEKKEERHKRPMKSTNTKPVFLADGKTVRCPNCEGEHFIPACPAFQEMSPDERFDKIKELELCISCFRPNHRAFRCFRRRECGRDGCKDIHHRLLHGHSRRTKNTATAMNSVPQEGKEEPKSEKKMRDVISASLKSSTASMETNETLMDRAAVVERGNQYLDLENTTYMHRVYAAANIHRNGIVMLRVAPVMLRNPRTGNTLSTFALLDSGATVTLIDKGIAEHLTLRGKPTSMRLQWLDGVARSQDTVTCVNLQVKGQYEKAKWFNLDHSYVIENLKLPETNVDREKLTRNYPYLSNVKFESIRHERPTILIGEDNAKLIATQQMVHDANYKPVASLTALGWVISGMIESRQRQNASKQMVCHASDNAELIELLKHSFSLESVGIRPAAEPRLTKDEQLAYEILNNTTKRMGNRFEAGLLWRVPRTSMPASRAAAWRRLQQTEAKMDRDPEFGRLYVEKMQHYLNEGYMIPLEESDSAVPAEETWYLPHFGVMNPNKPGKLRIVLDAAAEVNGVSLNKRLVSGPDLTTYLPKLLMQFRVGLHGFVGDIKEMFHQVRIRGEDQNYQRILWRAMDRDRIPQEYKMTVMIFGATCSPTIAAYVKNRNATDYRDEYPAAVQEIVDKHYVDDYLGSSDSVDEAVQLIHEVVDIHKKGGFEIRNFVSSSQEVLKKIPSEIRLQKSMVDLDLEPKFEKVLGVWWEPLTDVFSFRGQTDIPLDTTPTKRQALCTLMKVYDPMGFVAQFIIRGRIILQKIWRTGIEWDDQMPFEIYQTWRGWVEQLQCLEEVEIPRCYAPIHMKKGRVELHTFTDASEDAYATVIYLRFIVDDQIHVSLVKSKAKVSPLKAVSIPRLELQGAVIGSRLASFVAANIGIAIHRRIFWTDSTVALHWIKSDSRNFKPFVANRVGEIQEVSDPAEWRWVPTDLNVADLATRDKGSTDFAPTSVWYRGPEFLHQSENTWPKQREEETPLVAIAEIAEDTQFKSPINSKNYVKWHHMLKVAAFVFRFQRACKERWRTKCNKEHRKIGTLDAADWKGGEEYLIKIAQRESFQIGGVMEEATDTTKLRPCIVDKSSVLYKFNPAIDQKGFIRADGRLQRMPRVSPEFRNPVILHAGNRIVQLMLNSYHERLGHWGADHTLAELRTRFEIIKGRVTLKKLQRGCKICQIARAKPRIPIMGQLPPERLESHVIPFTYTGCDMFGPIMAKAGRSEVKRYGMIFTCLVTRAVHLELCTSMSTDSFLMALRRFFAHHTVPKKIMSDCGTNFRGAKKELAEERSKLNFEDVTQRMAQLNVEWVFNPPYAPHMGGCWERLIASVKHALKMSTELSAHPPSDEVLATLLAEAANMVNSRPLLELSDSGESLTPNHFLRHHKSSLTSGGTFDDKDLVLRKEWRKSQRLADHFWQIWTKHYAPTLSNRPKWRESEETVKVNDRVVVMDPNRPRNYWPTARVIKIRPGYDKKVRVVVIRMEEDQKEYTRPVARLGVLQPPMLTQD
ncbi:uncharacterized protein LOC132259062 [Phlebotomus argentipes]|uniref:uncharacterized protein LOC132259062 n=1 Tax=Phlebotomus argentipes TaxID=94469 RepID=UPI002892A5F8|nr:uncharacterized protein LOC132259062 [Phlebotomus argentipes]